LTERLDASGLKSREGNIELGKVTNEANFTMDRNRCSLGGGIDLNQRSRIAVVDAFIVRLINTPMPPLFDCKVVPLGYRPAILLGGKPPITSGASDLGTFVNTMVEFWNPFGREAISGSAQRAGNYIIVSRGPFHKAPNAQDEERGVARLLDPFDGPRTRRPMTLVNYALRSLGDGPPTAAHR